MKELLKLGLATLSISFLVGCVHSHKVVQATSDKTGLDEGAVTVGIGSKEVSVGDSVDILKSTCMEDRSPKRGHQFKNCYSKKVGVATVLHVLDEKSAVIKPLDGLAVDSTMHVEKSQ